MDDKGKRIEFLQQVVAEIPWGQHLTILNKVTAPAARLYYLRATVKFGWSRNVLLNQIKAKAYKRSLAEGKTHNFPDVLPEYLAAQAAEALKSSYNLEFLGIHRVTRERELEGRLIERVQQFILELGYGFCFVGHWDYSLRREGQSGSRVCAEDQNEPHWCGGISTRGEAAEGTERQAADRATAERGAAPFATEEVTHHAGPR